MDLGKELRSRRRERGEKLVDVAKEFGVGRATYRGWESGTRPGEAQWAKIARRLGCTVEEIEAAVGPHHLAARAGAGAA